MYWTVIVSWVPDEFQTKWHPSEEREITRGAFETVDEAIAWARGNLEGTPYSLKFYESINDERPLKRELSVPERHERRVREMLEKMPDPIRKVFER